MRLINTTSLEFRESFVSQDLQYAILSHRWTDDEISYKDFVKGRRKTCAGYVKIAAFCAFARSHGHPYIWVDTACIDKRSSAELSEAINSMFQWYTDADVCYVYLPDVSTSTSPTAEEQLHSFSASEWFERGWTLQELLAPSEVVFCSREWVVLGRKWGSTSSSSRFAPPAQDLWDSDVTLWAITQRTGIPGEVLQQPESFKTYSIAQRMSWMADRRTTRTEDTAYCLLGLFGINMPLLYGEGRRAFKRLQLEIIRNSHDESVYAWTRIGGLLNARDEYQILADSPRRFAGCGDVVRVPDIVRLPWSVTHHGLEIPLKADNDTREVEIQGFSVPTSLHLDISSCSSSSRGSAASSFSVSSGDELSDTHSTDHLRTAFRFPLGCRRAASAPADRPCELVIARMRCGHWGRIFTDDLNPTSLPTVARLRPVTIRFARHRVYVHLGECEDLIGSA